MKSSTFLIMILILVSCGETNNSLNIYNHKELINNFFIEIILNDNENNRHEIEELTMFYNNNQFAITKEERRILKRNLDSLVQISLKKYSYEELRPFLNIDKINKDEKVEILEMSNFVIMAYQEQINKENWSKIKILSYKEAKSDSIVSKSEIFKNLKYSDFDKVYFTVFDNNSNRVNFYIIDDNKIISFFPHLHKNKSSISPYFLNKKENVN
ncbi:hypothetical protein [Bizionia sp.]|uniref:hypothetical protein n=1 Tax=Bizionia sp. TaxID=1954480 RepID=UPI003A933F68